MRSKKDDKKSSVNESLVVLFWAESSVNESLVVLFWAEVVCGAPNGSNHATKKAPS
jgi:hypothetical protein